MEKTDLTLHGRNMGADDDSMMASRAVTRPPQPGSDRPWCFAMPPHSPYDDDQPAVRVIDDTGGSERDALQHRMIAERLRLLSESTFEGILFSEQGRVIDANEQFLEMLQYTRDDLFGRPLTDFIAPEDSHRAARHMRGGVTCQITLSMLRKDGTRISVEARAKTRVIGSRHVRVSVVRDITDRLRAASALTVAAAAFDASGDGILVTNASLVIVQVNKTFTDLTGYTAGELIGLRPPMLHSRRHTDAFHDTLASTVLTTGGWQGELWGRRKNGDEYCAWVRISAVRNPDGAVTHYVGAYSDMTERRLAEDRIRDLAFYDPLTHLPNRRLLTERLDRAVRAKDLYGALLFLDMDHFKEINDALGHGIGDSLLQAIGKRLSRCIRETDTAARFGGDEFVVLVEGLGQCIEEATANAKTVAETIRAALAEPYVIDGQRVHSTPSIGIVPFGTNDETAAELMRRADIAMYQAKAGGRNGTCFYSPRFQAAIDTRRLLEASLRQAIERGQLVLHYQPQMDAGRVVGAEALVRWKHPERGLLAPAEFIPLAEETGLIVPLGFWVLETACRQLALWADQPKMQHLTISVNVSASQLCAPNLVEDVRLLLERTGANPCRLKLELTETELMGRLQEALATMNALQMLGIYFSLDDFGTGYSSLGYLRHLPVHQLKIDRSFVADVHSETNAALIVGAIVGLGKAFGMNVIAEGVETAQQQQSLAELGCAGYQGYLFGKPVPAEDFEAEIARVRSCDA